MRAVLAIMLILGFAFVIVSGLLSVSRELFSRNPCQPSPVLDDSDHSAAS
jgi:hypothetical protein